MGIVNNSNATGETVQENPRIERISEAKVNGGGNPFVFFWK